MIVSYQILSRASEGFGVSSRKKNPHRHCQQSPRDILDWCLLQMQWWNACCSSSARRKPTAFRSPLTAGACLLTNILITAYHYHILESYGCGLVFGTDDVYILLSSAGTIQHNHNSLRGTRDQVVNEIAVARGIDGGVVHLVGPARMSGAHPQGHTHIPISVDTL